MFVHHIEENTKSETVPEVFLIKTKDVEVNARLVIVKFTHQTKDLVKKDPDKHMTQGGPVIGRRCILKDLSGKVYKAH